MPKAPKKIFSWVILELAGREWCTVPPPQGGNRHLVTVPPGVGGNRVPWGGGWTWGGQGTQFPGLMCFCTLAGTYMVCTVLVPEQPKDSVICCVYMFFSTPFLQCSASLSSAFGLFVFQRLRPHQFYSPPHLPPYSVL